MRPPCIDRRTWLLGTLAAATAGCGGRGDSAAPKSAVKGEPNANSSYRIGAVLPMFSHPFFTAQQRGLKAMAKALGSTIDIRDGQDDDQKQIVQVEALLNGKPDILILCPRDENALVPAVESANKAGVPVVTMNRRVNGGQVVCYVGADDVVGGRRQGEALVKALAPNGGKIIYLQGTPGSSPQVNRRKGFMEVLKNHPEIKIVADPFAGFQEDKAKAVMTGLVGRFKKGEIQAVVAQADEMALPAAEVAKAEGWEHLVVIGFNGTKDALAAVKTDLMYATILQNPVEQAEKAVQAAVDHLRGKPVPKEILTELPIVDRYAVHYFKPAY